MKISKISWKNLGPYGNKLQTIEFDKEGGLWMVVARNGAGKSFLVNLPKILFYGKLDGFKKDEIANRLNKHGELEGIIDLNNNTNVTIKRTLSPSNLTVYKHNKDEVYTNDSDIGKAGISNYQDYIDNEITKLPFHIFSNIISLSVNNFKSFISMSPSDKRIIIDKLFSMEILNKMYELIKKDLKANKNELEINNRELISINNSIVNASTELTELQNKIKSNNKKQASLIVEKMGQFKSKYSETIKSHKAYKKKYTLMKSKYEAITIQRHKINSELEELKKKEELFNQDKCPVCETPFTEKRFELIKEELEDNIKLKSEEIETILENDKTYSANLVRLKQINNKLNEYSIKLTSGFKTLENEYKKVTSSKSSNEEFKSIKKIIEANNIEAKKIEISKNENEEEYNHLTILIDLYSNSGVKEKILESYLPTLNNEIAYSLKELHFPYNLKFNSNFEPEMTHLGIEIGVDTLSTGEKKRVDIAVLISIIRMLKRKYHNMNIFMLDEILSSIDPDGIYDILGLLKQTAKDMKLNIFIINHSLLPIDYFSYKITIEKNGGFSDLDIEKIWRFL